MQIYGMEVQCVHCTGPILLFLSLEVEYVRYSFKKKQNILRELFRSLDEYFCCLPRYVMVRNSRASTRIMA
jgi:hypothetical protein